mmetsp:Transcript_14514/g.25524  ORF Transcript_14514/g.25524 Transcript_14514/m.25524 type:complete len:463 (-) Transcript_14514:136-1524(-)
MQGIRLRTFTQRSVLSVRCLKPFSTVTQVKSQVTFGPFGSGGTVTGTTSPGYEAVRAAFESSFALNLELGAQLVIYQGEEKVVDLFGSNAKQPGYTDETLQCVFSSGKNMESISVAMLVDRGLLSYHEKVSTYWPEFGQHGKEAITVADIMRHEGGMPFFSDPTDMDNPDKNKIVTEEVVQDPDALDKIIEGSGLWRHPDGTSRLYHALTRGWIVSGIVRRVDPKKRTLGKFIQEEVSEPLGITYFCGIPLTEQSKYSYADMTQAPPVYNMAFEVIPAMLGVGCPFLASTIKVMGDKSNSMGKPVVSWMKPPPTPAFNNTPLGRLLEIPSAGMYTNARSMAKVNACMANGGIIGGVRLLSEKASADALAGLNVETDPSLKLTSAFSQAGLADMSTVSSPLVDPSINLHGFFGWGGWGGSISIWNPEKKLALSYAMNGMSNYLLGGPRYVTLAKALKEVSSKL